MKQEQCPKCRGLVYAEHYKDKWRLNCCQCGLHTEWYLTHNQARKAWDKSEVKDADSN